MSVGDERLKLTHEEHEQRAANALAVMADQTTGPTVRQQALKEIGCRGASVFAGMPGKATGVRDWHHVSIT